jgi:hypothetical protein
MKANKIEESKVYELKVGKNITTVKIVRIERRVNGQLAFVCENANTHKLVTVTDAERFVKAVKVKDEPAEKKTLKEVIESKGITMISKGHRATTSMRDLDDPTFTRKHHVDENGVLVLEADDEMPETTRKAPRIKDDGTMSAINAAHKVLTEEGRAMNAREIYETAVERGYCKLNGLTPVLTISAIIQIDIKKRGDESRFYKAGRGLFAAR